MEYVHDQQQSQQMFVVDGLLAESGAGTAQNQAFLLMQHQQNMQQYQEQQQQLLHAQGSQRQQSHQQPMRPQTDEQPMYVNAKQYHRILKRREARAALMARIKPGSKTSTPYAHESRHKHAMRRPRGPGGRFLSAAELAMLKELEAAGTGGVNEAIAMVAAANAAAAVARVGMVAPSSANVGLTTKGARKKKTNVLDESGAAPGAYA